MKVTIWHNPQCGSSRKALERLEAKRGVEVEVYLYLKEKPSKAAIQAVLAKLKLQPSGLLRAREPEAEALGLYDGAAEARILDALAQHPRLIQRPIVISPKGAVIARPPERADEAL